MPCRCEVTEREEAERASKADEKTIKGLKTKLKHANTKICALQDLVVKVSPAPGLLADDLKARVVISQTELLDHKKKEHNKDITRIKANIAIHKDKVAEIKRLGGVPNKALKGEIKALEKELDKLEDTTDEEILGHPLIQFE